ncbi:MAG TPA: NfeD family protein [Jatrophihabitantaceae bacterium]|nr:NfeD family protein [Jatrophihabitantaceae bacterium]
MPAWLIWVIAAGVLAGAETLSLDLVLIMCAGGAAGGAITAAAGGGAVLQVIVAIVSAALLLGLVRPVAKRHLVGIGTHQTGSAALVGKQAVVLSAVDEHDGRVRLNGAEWSARSYDRTQTLAIGQTVRVMEIDGATAVVWQEP